MISRRRRAAEGAPATDLASAGPSDYAHVPRRADRGLPAQIAASLGRRILEGELEPGMLLANEAKLIADLDVSRTTLREAMKILSAKGFVEARPKIGTRILPATDWNLLDPVVLTWLDDPDPGDDLAGEFFELRLAIEPMAARLAAERATEADLEEIRAAFATMEAAPPTAAEAIEADIAFHLRIMAAAHNRFFMPIAGVIRAALTLSIPRTLASFGGFSIERHRSILTAIERRDPEGAAQAVEELIRFTYARNFTRNKG